MGRIKRLYKLVVRPLTNPVLGLFMKLLDGRQWVPVFYWFLPRQNTNAVQVLHVLHSIQVKTGRRVVVISAWPFWPWDTSRDPSFRSFIRGLNSRIRFLWIPAWLQRLSYSATLPVWRLAQIQHVLFRPMGLRSTIRFTGYSTLDHTDIVNHKGRVAFHIPKTHTHSLEERLRDLGVSTNAWFVCVHAREHGWFKDTNAYDLKHRSGYQHEQEDHRNVDIRDYFPAISHITSRGGLVVRMGDPSMTRISGIDGVIDYPFTEHKSLPMDLFLMSRCRFVLGCTSGFSSSFPIAFDIPLLITNFPGPAFTVRFPGSNTIVMPSHVAEKGSGRVLSMREMFHPDIRTMNDSVALDAMGYRWISNEPDAIVDATREMFDLVETNSFERPRTREQELFHRYRLEALDALWSPVDQRGNPRWSNVRSAESRISATFASRYFSNEKLEAMAVQTPLA